MRVSRHIHIGSIENRLACGKVFLFPPLAAVNAVAEAASERATEGNGGGGIGRRHHRATAGRATKGTEVSDGELQTTKAPMKQNRSGQLMNERALCKIYGF